MSGLSYMIIIIRLYYFFIMVIISLLISLICVLLSLAASCLVYPCYSIKLAIYLIKRGHKIVSKPCFII